MIDKTVRKAQGARLAQARDAAGYQSAREAALANGWKESTYRAHENGTRTIGRDDAEKYAKRFSASGVKISAQEILFPSMKDFLPDRDGGTREAVNKLDLYQRWVAAGLEKPGKKAGELARILRVGPSQISRITNGTRKVKADELPEISAYLEEPPPGMQQSESFPPDRDGDITRGPVEGAPPEYDDGTPRIGNGKRVHIRAGFIPEFDLRAGASYGGGYALQAQIVDGTQTFDAEVVKAEWGIPSSFLEGELRLHPLKTDVIAVDGPSMLPDLMPGDRVLIDRSHTDPRQGGIFAVREDDGIIIKHVEVIRGSDPLRIVCKSSNQTYAPFELVLDGERVSIIGRVAGRISRM